MTKKLFFILFFYAASITVAQAQILPQGANTNYSGLLEEAIKAYEEDPNKENKKKVKILADWVADGAILMSFILGDSESYSGPIPGISFGFRTSLTRPDRNFVLDAGLNFTNSGGAYEEYQYEPGGGGNSSNAKLRLNYLNLPVTAKYRKDINKGFYAEAGLQPGLLLSAKAKRESGTADAKDEFKSFDLGVVLGAGYQISRKLGAGIRVVPGITNINKDENYALKDRNLGISLRASYRLF